MSIKKRKDPMVILIIVAVLMALLAVGTFILGGKIRDYRAQRLYDLQMAVKNRNDERYAEYAREVDEYSANMAQDSYVNESWPSPAPEGWDVVDLTNYPLEVPGRVNVNRSDIMNNGLLLVNPWHSRPADFDESSIVSVSGYARDSGLDSFWDDSSCQLFPVAVDALINMLTDAKNIGLEHYVLQKNYTYRTYDRQMELFNAEVERLRARHSSYTEERLIERAKDTINYPGTSEFNTGLSFRMYLYDGEDSNLGNMSFYETEQGKWLYNNSWKYGFVFRFPVRDYPVAGTIDKGYKTGVNGAQNTYRYVGVANATVMTHMGLCLEEYIEFLQNHPHVAVFENGQKRYEITRQQVGDDVASFSVEINRMTNNYTMYLDNMGGVITVYTY